MSLVDSWLFLVVLYDFGWFLVILSGSLRILMVICGSLKSFFNEYLWFLVVLIISCGSLWFFVVLDSSWLFLVVFGGF